MIFLREVYVLLSDNPCLGLIAMCTTRIRLVTVLIRVANLWSLNFPSVIWVLVLTNAPCTKLKEHLKITDLSDIRGFQTLYPKLFCIQTVLLYLQLCLPFKVAEFVDSVLKDLMRH